MRQRGTHGQFNLTVLGKLFLLLQCFATVPRVVKLSHDDKSNYSVHNS